MSEGHIEIAVEGPIVTVYYALRDIMQVQNLLYSALLCLICFSHKGQLHPSIELTALSWLWKRVGVLAN